MRGERCRRETRMMDSTGSSPHTRGTHDRASSCRSNGRFIPAYAGNARPAARPSQEVPVHPRMRGERGDGADPPIQTVGSSPHTRGTHGDDGDLERLPRFILAYAGNAVHCLDESGALLVHPRIRGERELALCVLADRLGSSPHARGTHFLFLRLGLFERFIPAYAGNALSLLTASGA